jgi:hypothetical protein
MTHLIRAMIQESTRSDGGQISGLTCGANNFCVDLVSPSDGRMFGDARNRTIHTLSFDALAQCL